MNRYTTVQEEFWAGHFGDEYISRNQGENLVSSNIALFAQALRHTQCLRSILELGANIGLNLQALYRLLPATDLHALEINSKAVAELRKLDFVETVTQASILEYIPPKVHDLVLVKGVLIHMAPEVLNTCYDVLAAASRRYVLIVEYYNPVPVEISYRGHEQRLFKRDFAGEFMQRHPRFELLDYGFVYRLDPKWRQDDATWFLLEKYPADMPDAGPDVD